MPELPEVQNTVEGIREHVIGYTIKDVWTDYGSPAYLGKPNIKDPAYFRFFKKHVVGKTIVSVKRRAKQIFITLNCGHIISVHMKMTGHFLVGQWDWNRREKKWQPPAGFWNQSWDLSRDEVKKTMPLSEPYNDFIHLMLTLNDGRQLAFSDMRKFGTVSLLSNEQEYTEATAHYGPEPLDPKTTFKVFMSKITTRPNMMVKPALLDQSLVAGFGNIYSDEVLFTAGVHPESVVSHIPEDRWRAIYTAGRKLLQKAIKHGGDSTGDYRKVDGRGGTFHGLHQVYGRDGQPCLDCGEIIEKKQIGARIGRFCSHCQTIY